MEGILYNKLKFFGFKNKTEFQKEVIRIILCEDKFDIFYLGRTEDLGWKMRANVFSRRDYKKGDGKQIIGKKLKEKWEGLMLITDNPEYCIIMWKRLTNISKFKEKKSRRNNVQ